eukprot:13558377-Alexandrium_andersonii.AAC.1
MQVGHAVRLNLPPSGASFPARPEWYRRRDGGVMLATSGVLLRRLAAGWSWAGRVAIVMFVARTGWLRVLLTHGSRRPDGRGNASARPGCQARALRSTCRALPSN